MRLDSAIAHVQELPPTERAIAQEYAVALDALARDALTTMVRRFRDDARGKELLFELIDDPAVRMLLGIHGIIRLPDPEQADRTGPPAANRAFVPVGALFRGPQDAAAQDGGACGCGPECTL
jgi:hypothetical protein